uniref:Uncharacterized protein n=1 Tax=Setaria viridis TaxID=4556 RepID=A0A4U6SQC3_SETVI|nr:hypothetical protein SEVIR_9G058500v2 [Setaria viridis]
MPTLGQVKYKIICYCDSKSIKFVVTVAGTVELGKDVVVAATQVDLITFGLSSRSSRKRKRYFPIVFLCASYHLSWLITD